MSYENAVPKPLKFLISDGKMIDDEGNVIAESETLKDLYTKWEPEVKKYLLSDGSVVDEEGNLIIKNDWWKSFYDMACPKVAKYLHADGTVDENPGGGSADLEDNHQTTIDVSTYTQPVEVTPTSGKDGMKKNTITLTNIPSGSGDIIFHAWHNNTLYNLFTLSPNPQVGDIAYELRGSQGDSEILILMLGAERSITAVIKSVTENGIVIECESEDYEFTRDTEDDVTIPKSST